jgi:mRNA-degrading endonuclease RelE of RelBE toxin-antitoxin system
LETSSGNRTIQRTKRFARDIKKLSQPIQEEAFGIAQQLAQDIFDRDLNIRSMTGFKGVYRVVVMRDYRMIFSFSVLLSWTLQFQRNLANYHVFRLPIVDDVRTFFESLSEEVADTVAAAQGVMVA